MIKNLPLQSKLLYLTIFLLVSLCLSVSIYLKTHFAHVLSVELLERGKSITRHVAEICAGAFIERDYLQLETLAKEHMAAERDIVYIIMLNQNSEVVAHSFSGGYPIDLNKIMHSINGAGTSVREINYGGGPLYDIAAPVLDSRIGTVRIGISAGPVNESVNAMVGQIIGVIALLGLIGFLVILPFVKSVVSPVAALTRAVKGVAAGEWPETLPVTSNDELGQLSAAFNHMVQKIADAEVKLASHAEFLQVLIDDIPLPVFYKDTQGVLLGCNHAYCNFWGKPKEEIVGAHTVQVYISSDAELHLDKDRDVLNLDEPISYEHSIVDAKGRTRHVIFNKAIYSDNTGQPAGVIGVMQDVTEQRQSDRMKNEFVSTVAHEFQTPLSTILGFAELLRDGVMSQSEREEALDLILQKSEALSEMVDELLDLARIETGKGLKVNLEPCDVREALSELIENFSRRTASHQFDLELPEGDVVVHADKTRMGQVMENLLSNAVKYSEKQSLVRIVVTSLEASCQVQVADQGIGLTERQRGMVFEKYYRADTSNTAPPGTGLGLFITKSIIDAHNGEIDIESRPGEGTSVTFRIPRHSSMGS